MKNQQVYPKINIQKALRWAQKFPYAFFSTSNSIAYPSGGFRNFLAVGNTAVYINDKKSFFDQLDTKSWLFGCMGYDLKNQIEDLSSNHPHLLDLGSGSFFKPDILIEFFEEKVGISASDPEKIRQEIVSTTLEKKGYKIEKVSPLTSQEQYIRQVKKILDYIEEGEVYELNYCVGFRAAAEVKSPDELFWQLNTLSPMPFACFFKQQSQYLICASPERFLKKQSQTLLSQPIKGTSRRSPDPEEDKILKNKLLNSPKERAENMMIVDLVRNDLAKISKVGSVTVEEMFGLYTFRQVHQMISSISSQSDATFSQIMSSLFPMGSMTGAPKIRAMQLIDELENFSRGYFSGAAGYITPDGDFDFNVVIRSILLDKQRGELGFAAGGAITYDSDPHAEYQEIRLKTQAIAATLWPR